MKVIHNTLVKEFHRAYQIPFVFQKDMNKNSPPFPFIAYNITTPHIPFVGEGNFSRELKPSLDERFDFDIVETRVTQPTVTYSFTTYSNDNSEALEAALLLRDWLMHIGTELFRDNNFVIVEASAIQDRTIELVGSYEYRYGFDAEIRYVRTVERRLETIERASAQINGEQLTLFDNLE